MTRVANTVSIRPISAEDTDNIVRWRNLDSVRGNFISREQITRESHLEYLRTRVFTGHVAQFIITDTGSGRDIGSVFLRDIDRVNSKAEFGIFIGEEDMRGHGRGGAAARLILKHAFDSLGLNRVFLRVIEDNRHAISSYESVGFKYEGTFRQDVAVDGKMLNIVFMAILKKDWCDSLK